VDEDLGTEQVHLAEDPWSVGGRVDDDDVLGGGCPERDLRCREVLAGPVPALVVRLPDVPGFGQEREQVVDRPRPEDLARLERHLEGRGPEMCEQDVQVVRVEAGLLGRRLEQELGVVDDVLVHRAPGRDEDGDARAEAPAGAADLLPRPGHRARIAGQDRHVEPTDIHPELERVGRDHAEDLPVPKPAFDRPTLGGQVAAPIAPDLGSRTVALAERLAETRQQDLHRDPRSTEHDGLATGAQERERPALRQVLGRGACATGRLRDGRVHEEDVQQTITGRLP
jgi:hypothetical protein